MPGLLDWMDDAHAAPGMGGGLLGDWSTGPSKNDSAKKAMLQAAFQMLAGSRQRGIVENIGNAGLAGMQTYGADRQMQRQNKMQDAQLEMLLQDAARKKADFGRQQTIQGLASQFSRPGGAPAVDATGGMETSVDNPNNVARPQGFDMKGYADAVMGIDPMMGLQIQSAIAKNSPESQFGKVDPKDYTPDSIRMFAATGNHAVLIPVRKAEFVGGQAVDPYNIKPGTVLDVVDPNKPFGMRGGQPVANTAYQQYELGKAKAGATSVSVNTGQKGFDNELKLRGDFRGEPVYKAHQEMQSAYAQIQQSLKQATPAGDLAGATKIMKLLDPGSVVRESELGMAMAATGLLDRVQSYATNIMNGTKLTPKQRTEFQALADALYGESVKAYNAKRTEYDQLGRGYDLNTDRLLGPAAPMPAVPAPAGKASAPGKVMRFDAQGNRIN